MPTVGSKAGHAFNLLDPGNPPSGVLEWQKGAYPGRHPFTLM